MDIVALQQWVKSLYRANGQDAERLWIEPFSYPVSLPTFAAVGGVATGVIAINANADFVCTRINYECALGTVQNASTRPIAQARALIVDAGSSRPFFNAAAPLETFASNQYPNRFLPYPRWLSANTTVSIQLTGYGTAAENYTIDMVFEGVAVRQFSGAM
jgi:hypothetical protein